MKKTAAIFTACLLCATLLTACSDKASSAVSSGAAQSAASDAANSEAESSSLADNEEISALQDAEAQLQELFTKASSASSGSAEAASQELLQESQSVLDELNALDFEALSATQASRLLDAVNNTIEKYGSSAAEPPANAATEIEMTLKNDTTLFVAAVGLRNAAGEETARVTVAGGLAAGSVCRVQLFLPVQSGARYTLFTADKNGAETNFSGEFSADELGSILLSETNGAFTAAMA